MSLLILTALKRAGRIPTALAVLLSTTLFIACSDDGSPTRVKSAPGIQKLDRESAVASSHDGRPATVTDLSASGAGATSVVLEWTEVSDGDGGPADYQIRYAPTPIGWGWGQATVVTEGPCASPVEGAEVGAGISCAVSGLDRNTSYDFQLVAFRTASDGSRVYSRVLSDVATAQTTNGVPGTVTDLSVSATTSSTATLEWTAVADGAGGSALYGIRRAPTPMGYGWGDATVVTEGECAAPVEGGAAGSTVSCTVEGLAADASQDFQLVAFRRGADGSRAYSEELSNVATAKTEPKAPTKPAAVTDLSVSATSAGSAALTWTEVDDGSGAPAAYQIRYALTPLGWGWGDATTVRSGECASPVDGSRVGSTISCTVTGLDAGTSYDFQLVSFRDESDGTRIYAGGLSNVATGATAALTVETGTDDGTDGATTDSGSTADTGSGSGSYPFEPADFSRLVETTYASASEGGFRSSTNSNFSIVDDAGAPRSPSKVARATFPVGLGDGRSPIWSDAAISGHSARRIYLSFWVKVSENWQAHSTGVNKVAFAWTHQKPVVIASILGTGSGRLGSEIRIQDVPDGARNLTPNRSDPEIMRGRWHRWEIVLASNTGDAADGEVHWWVDGTKAGAYTDVRFGTSSQSKIWDYVTWRPVWGGRGDVIEQTQYMWMDHYYASGAR